MHRRLLHTALIVFIPFAMSIPIVAQDSGPAPAQMSPDAAARGVYKVGGDVSAPVLIHSVEPTYPDNATDTGTVQVTMWVDIHGNPTHVRVTHGLGMGLDQRAIEAVRQYKYKPGTKDGKPVMVELSVEVKFQRSAN
jgi:TonB family protein